MGYYENPPMINMNDGYNEVSKGILNMANSISKGLLEAGERRREKEKEEELSLKKLQQQKNEVDLLYNDKLSDWSQKNKVSNKEVDDKIHGLIQQKISAAADARIALLNETDSSKRAAYLGVIRQADTFMNNAAKFTQVFAGETASYRENLSPTSYGVPGGMVVNGSPEEMPSRTMALNVMSGMSQQYKSHSIEIEDLGDTFKLSIGAEDASGNKIQNIVDASSYLSSEEGGTGTYLQKVINNDDWNKTAKQTFYDEKSKNILQKYLKKDVEQVHIPVLDTKGKDIGSYQLGKGQRIDETGIKIDLRKQADIKASSFLKAGKEADLRAYVNCTLGKDVQYYDKIFKSAPNKQELLSDLLVESSFGKLTEDLHRTIENGKPVYWGDQTQVEEETVYKDKSSKGKGEDSKKTESIESIAKRIGNIQKGQIGDFTYNGRKVAYDGDSFTVERTAGLKDLVFKTKKDVINYLKSGSTGKPQP